MNFIFLGPPGAGKGTLAFEVAKSASIPHISTGDIFRQAIRDKTELGLKVKAIIDSGALVSDEITTALVAERLKADDCKNGFILDGFPRTIPQAEALAQLVTIDKAINFDISDEEVIKRLSGRRTCTSCGKVYNIVSMPPKQENCCDACGAALITRDDDKPESNAISILHLVSVSRRGTKAASLFFFLQETKQKIMHTSKSAIQIFGSFLFIIIPLCKIRLCLTYFSKLF